MQVLTLDFHNTLANCDPWFDLEVRDLPWAVIERLDLATSSAGKDQVDSAYRALRLEVIASGNEIDAYDSVALLFEQFEIAAPSASVNATIDTLMMESTSFMEPVPGAAGTVRHLHASGVRMGVVSSAVHHLTLEWILGRMGIDTCFDTIVTSASAGFYKSTPAIYHAALRHLGGHAASSVHVGDSLKWDVSVAQQAGLHAVWLQTQRREVFSTGPQESTPVLTLQSMEDAGPQLIDLLDRVRAPLNV